MPDPHGHPQLVELGLLTDHFEEAVHLYRDVLGLPVVDESPEHVRLNFGPVELVISRTETSGGRYSSGARLVVEVDRRDGQFSQALQSARRVAIAATFDDGDREYTDLRGPDGEYLLISQPDRRSSAIRSGEEPQ